MVTSLLFPVLDKASVYNKPEWDTWSAMHKRKQQPVLDKMPKRPKAVFWIKISSSCLGSNNEHWTTHVELALGDLKVKSIW